jgi:hypothetical protein
MYIALFSHFIPCGVHEAVYILDGLIRNGAEIKPDTIHGDTQAQSGPGGGQMSELPMLTYVEFRSDKFPAYKGEEEQINPDLWGKRLAEFLCDKLLAKGFKTEEPLAEDWGRRIDVVNEAFSLWIGCGHYQEYPDGYLCFIEPHTHYVHRLFRKINTQERIASLQQALDKILVETDGVRAKRWWTHEEFNNPMRKGSPA